MFYDIYVNLCSQNKLSPSAAAERVGLSRTSVVKWKNGTIPSGATLIAFAKLFGVSVDYLLGNEQKEAPALTEKDQRDISKKLQQTLDQLEASQEGLMFDGEPLDDETKELLALSLRNSMELGKKIAK